MNKKYQAWIKNYQGDIFRKCVEVSTEMQKVFPELIIVKGFVRIIENPEKEYPHQWLQAPNGAIIDPTAKQWARIIAYREHKEKDPYPIGICRECGEQIYSDNLYAPEFCSLDCEKSYIAYLN